MLFQVVMSTDSESHGGLRLRDSGGRTQLLRRLPPPLPGSPDPPGYACYELLCADHAAVGFEPTLPCLNCMPQLVDGVRVPATTLMMLPVSDPPDPVTAYRDGGFMIPPPPFRPSPALISPAPRPAKPAKTLARRGGDHTLSDHPEFAGDRDREKAVALLREAWRGGYLDEGQFLERTAAAWAARTQGDLAAVRERLPATLGEAAPAPRAWSAQDYLTVFMVIGLVAGVIWGLAALPWW